MDASLFPSGCFVTGTDTEVGKTFSSAALLHAMRRDGRPAIGMKPVASGSERTPQGWRNADALALQAASQPRPEYLLVNPYALPEPTAPQIAARLAGTSVSLPTILAAHAALSAQAGGRVLVEGVGGWLAPLADGLDQADLVRALGLPVVLVVGLKLGCLNHARLTERAIVADGCRWAGWIGNAVEPPGPHAEAYLDLLRRHLPGPCLGVLPHAPGADPAALAANLAAA